LGGEEGSLGTIDHLGSVVSILHLGPVAWYGCFFLSREQERDYGCLRAGVSPILFAHLAVLGCCPVALSNVFHFCFLIPPENSIILYFCGEVIIYAIIE